MSTDPEPAVICHACGRSWHRHPALEVPCPRCRADAGAQCARPSGHSGTFVEPHVSRERRAVDEGLLELCPEGPTMSGAGAGSGRDAEAAAQPDLFETA